MSSTTAAYTVVVPGPHLMPALCGPRDVYLRQIERVPGVTGVAYADWFGAKYDSDPLNILQIADSDRFTAAHR